jgi:antitoxin YokJ
MKKVIDTIEKVKQDSSCNVLESKGLPTIPSNLSMPKDLEQFYNYCGGITFFEDEDYPIQILEPVNFQRANILILGEDYEEDISHNWYTIAKYNGEYISIDLSKKNNGRCYDCSWDIHGVAGSQPIISNTFFDLLTNVYKSKGQYWYWLNSTFDYIGDAYD